MTQLCDMLIYLRKRARLTQQELAEKTGLTRSAIGMYETGKREPDLETLEIFADFYNVDMNTLTGSSSVPDNDKELDPTTREIMDMLSDFSPDKLALARSIIASIKESG